MQCLTLSTFLLCQLNLSPFLDLKCFLCPLCHDKYLCVCMFECVSMRVRPCGFTEISENTVGNYQRNLQQCHVSLSFSDSRQCYLQVCPAQTAYICLSPHCVSSSFIGWHSILLFLYKVFVSSRRERFPHYIWGGGKTEVPTCPSRLKEKKLKGGAETVSF